MFFKTIYNFLYVIKVRFGHLDYVHVQRFQQVMHTHAHFGTGPIRLKTVLFATALCLKTVLIATALCLETVLCATAPYLKTVLCATVLCLKIVLCFKTVPL